MEGWVHVVAVLIFVMGEYPIPDVRGAGTPIDIYDRRHPQHVNMAQDSHKTRRPIVVRFSIFHNWVVDFFNALWVAIDSLNIQRPEDLRSLCYMLFKYQLQANLRSRSHPLAFELEHTEFGLFHTWEPSSLTLSRVWSSMVVIHPTNYQQNILDPCHVRAVLLI